MCSGMNSMIENAKCKSEFDNLCLVNKVLLDVQKNLTAQMKSVNEFMVFVTAYL